MLTAPAPPGPLGGSLRPVDGPRTFSLVSVVPRRGSGASSVESKGKREINVNEVSEDREGSSFTF